MARNDEDLTVSQRESLSDRDIINMLATLTRHEAALKSALDKSHPDLFDPGAQHFMLYWEVLREYVERHNEMPRRGTLASILTSAVDTYGDELDDDQVDQLNQIVTQAYAGKKSELAPSVALSQYRALLEESMLRQLRRQLAMSGAPRDIAGVLAKARDQAAAIGALDAGGIDVPFGEQWQPQAVEKISTGFPFVDLFLEGGDVEGEVYGLLGPVGSCKTTLMVQFSTGGALRDWAIWEASGRKCPLKISYHFNYEGPIDAIKQRALCCTALIDKDILALPNFEKELNRTAGKLRPYEHQLLRGLIQTESMPTEYRRYQSAKKRLNRNWRVVDMSGNDKQYPGRGAGMVSEIVEIISRDLERIRRDGIGDVPGPIEAECGAVCVDYVSTACERAVMTGRHDDHDRAMRRAITRFGLCAKNDLATGLNARVWLAQQLSGDANSLTPGRLPKRTDSKDNRMFAENLDFCFIIGNPDQNNLVAFGTDKQRRAGRRPPEVLQILGNLNTVLMAKGHVIDPATNRFVRSEDRGRIADVDLSQHRTSRKQGFDRQLLG